MVQYTWYRLSTCQLHIIVTDKVDGHAVVRDEYDIVFACQVFEAAALSLYDWVILGRVQVKEAQVVVYGELGHS